MINASINRSTKSFHANLRSSSLSYDLIGQNSAYIYSQNPNVNAAAVIKTHEYATVQFIRDTEADCSDERLLSEWSQEKAKNVPLNMCSRKILLRLLVAFQFSYTNACVTSCENGIYVLMNIIKLELFSV